MNILILFSQPWRVGGAETHVEALISGLHADNILLAINRGSDKEKLARLQQQYPSLQIIEIQARGINICRWGTDLYRLASIIKKNDINIVSAQQRTAGLWACILRKITDVPFVVTMHDPWHRAFLKKSYARIFPTMIVVSRNLTEILKDKFAFEERQINFINNGIDFAAFVPQEMAIARQKLGLIANNKIILHVSRLSSVKGAVGLKLLDSMTHILRQDNQMKLIIIGEGPLQGKIIKKAEIINQQYPNAVEVRNFTDNISIWYNAADVVVGEGRVAIEVLACQRPIVAIRNGQQFFGAVTAENITAAMEVNFDGQSLSVTPEMLATEINKAFLVDDKQRVEIAQMIVARLSIGEMAERYYKVFRNTISGEIHEKNTNY